MDAMWAAVLGGMTVLAIGGVAWVAFRQSEKAFRRTPVQTEPTVPPDVARVLSVLRSSAVVIGPHDEVLQASAPARAYGLVRGNRLAVEDLLSLVRQVRRDGEIRVSDFELRRDRLGHDLLSLHARVAPISSQLVLVLVEDRTKERRLDAIRRDFVANVSHELKTPIGALGLLAEAVQDAADDPEAVQRFSARMQTESTRLSRLVHQIIELSRVQGDDPVEEAEPVAIDTVVEAAMDRRRVDAEEKQISLLRNGLTGLMVMGNEQQLTIALGNLVENAVAYSPERTRVVVDIQRARADEGLEVVDIAVTDRGVGIPEEEVERVFERFYRVDPARSRDTGGTGLGLSIVKHVAASHGGTVTVWSARGQGSTFTVRLPLRVDSTGEPVQVPRQAGVHHDDAPQGAQKGALS